MSKASEVKSKILKVKYPGLINESRTLIANWLEADSTNNLSAATIHDTIKNCAIKESVDLEDADNYEDLLNKLSDDSMVTIIAQAQDKGFVSTAETQPEELEEANDPYSKAYVDLKKVVSSDRLPALKQMINLMKNGEDEKESLGKFHFGAAQSKVETVLKGYGITESQMTFDMFIRDIEDTYLDFDIEHKDLPNGKCEVSVTVRGKVVGKFLADSQKLSPKVTGKILESKKSVPLTHYQTQTRNGGWVSKIEADGKVIYTTDIPRDTARGAKMDAEQFCDHYKWRWDLEEGSDCMKESLAKKLLNKTSKINEDCNSPADQALDNIKYYVLDGEAGNTVSGPYDTEEDIPDEYKGTNEYQISSRICESNEPAWYCYDKDTREVYSGPSSSEADCAIAKTPSAVVAYGTLDPDGKFIIGSPSDTISEPATIGEARTLAAKLLAKLK